MFPGLELTTLSIALSKPLERSAKAFVAPSDDPKYPTVFKIFVGNASAISSREAPLIRIWSKSANSLENPILSKWALYPNCLSFSVGTVGPSAYPIVALARAIAPKPKLVLMDEPFSSLDTHLRRSLARELKEVLADQGIAHLLVTHDQQEAFAMADYIGVMHEGSLLQWDSPYNLYHKPQDAQIAAFIGEGYFIAGKVCDQNDTVSTVLGDFNIANGTHFQPNQDVLVLMRPDDLKPNSNSTHRAKVSHKVFKGAIIEYELELPNKERLKAIFPSHHDYSLSQDIGFDLDIQHLIVYPNLISV